MMIPRAPGQWIGGRDDTRREQSPEGESLPVDGANLLSQLVTYRNFGYTLDETVTALRNVGYVMVDAETVSFYWSQLFDIRTMDQSTGLDGRIES